MPIDIIQTTDHYWLAYNETAETFNKMILSQNLYLLGASFIRLEGLYMFIWKLFASEVMILPNNLKK